MKGVFPFFFLNGTEEGKKSRLGEKKKKVSDKQKERKNWF